MKRGELYRVPNPSGRDPKMSLPKSLLTNYVGSLPSEKM